MPNINVICKYEDCTSPATRAGKTICPKHYKREYVANNPEYREKARAYANERRLTTKFENEVAHLESIRVNNLRTNYNISVEMWDTMLLNQDFRCGICKRHQSEFSKNFAVDHNHSCCPGRKSCGSCVRGLLCVNCNNGLGRFGDNAEYLESAAQYLKANTRTEGENDA